MSDQLPKENIREIETELNRLRLHKAKLWRALEQLCQIAEFRGLVVGPQDARKVLAETRD